MKEIENKITEWEASLKSWKQTASNESVLQATWLIKGLELALKIVNEKNNKKLQACACGDPNYYAIVTRHICTKCNKPLSATQR